MKSERRGSANNSGCGFVLVALGVAVFAAKGGYDTGWNVGVRAHAKGEAVVVRLGAEALRPDRQAKESA